MAASEGNVREARKEEEPFQKLEQTCERPAAFLVVRPMKMFR